MNVGAQLNFYLLWHPGDDVTHIQGVSSHLTDRTRDNPSQTCLEMRLVGYLPQDE